MVEFDIVYITVANENLLIKPVFNRKRCNKVIY